MVVIHSNYVAEDYNICFITISTFCLYNYHQIQIVMTVPLVSNLFTFIFLSGILLGSIAGVQWSSEESEKKPNIVVIYTDDQRWDTVDFMPTVKKLAAEGVTFTNSFVSTPLCCPSRASFLTGQYAHNHGVLTNKPPNGGAPKFNDTETLATALHKAGYATAYVGKYLNAYQRISTHIPPGWDYWHVAIKGLYYSYTLNEDGIIKEYGNSPSDYSTDVFAEKATEFIAATKRPFFLMFAPKAPHGDDGFAVPAPRHEGTCDNLTLHRPSGFNEEDVSDKPKWIRTQPKMDAAKIADIDLFRKQQICSLKAVDDAVFKIINTLGSEIDNTVIIFTSDNGITWGEHRIGSKEYGSIKDCIYEECVRVPLVLYYPNMIKTPKQIDEFVLNIDITPTLAEIARAKLANRVDGKSLLPLLTNQDIKWRDVILLEYYLRHGYYSAAVRTENYKYVELGTGENELYDMVNDPYELRNIVTDPAYQSITTSLKERLEQLKLAGSDVLIHLPLGPAKVEVSNTAIINMDNKMTGISVENRVLVQGSLENQQDQAQVLVYIAQIKNADGYTVSLSWIEGNLQDNQSMKAAIPWTPDLPGDYTAEIFVWNSVSNPTPLSEVVKINFSVS